MKILEEEEVSIAELQQQQLDDEEITAFRRRQARKLEPLINEDALKEKYKSMKSSDAEFRHYLLTTAQEPLNEVDTEDDLTRELAFYKQALECVKGARAKCDKENIKYRRPDDYFAEMIKSDAHMAKIKTTLKSQTERISGFETKIREESGSRSLKKKEHDARVSKKARAKEELSELEKWRKDSSGDPKERQARLEKVLSGDYSTNRSAAGQKRLRSEEKTDGRPARKSRKRRTKDQIYGHGGKKAIKKKNTGKSSGDMKSFNPKKNKAYAKSVPQSVKDQHKKGKPKPKGRKR